MKQNLLVFTEVSPSIFKKNVIFDIYIQIVLNFCDYTNDILRECNLPFQNKINSVIDHKKTDTNSNSIWFISKTPAFAVTSGNVLKYLNTVRIINRHTPTVTPFRNQAQAVKSICAISTFFYICCGKTNQKSNKIQDADLRIGSFAAYNASGKYRIHSNQSQFSTIHTYQIPFHSINTRPNLKPNTASFIDQTFSPISISGRTEGDTETSGHTDLQPEWHHKESGEFGHTEFTV